MHSPRSRTRGIGAAAAVVVALVASLLTVAPAQALSETGSGGVFVPATGRALDTLKGTGGYSTPMPANTWRTVKIAGLPGIPDDGSVGAVSLNVTASGTTGYGTVFGRPDADTSRTMMMIYNGNQGDYVSNSAVVAVSAAGTIQVQTETAARLILDVQGYYTANTDGTAAGGFVPVAGKRIVDTRSGLGAPKALLAPGKSVDIQVTGANGVPAGASAAVVNLLPINTASSDGYLTPYATGETRPANALHYAPSANTSIQAQVPLSSDGKMTVYNGSSTANLVIDLQGYFTAAGNDGATFTPGVGRVFNSRAADSAILAKNETRAIPVAGIAGVPVMGSGLTAVVLTLTALHGGSDGRASVWANGTTQPDTTSINFLTDEIRTNTVTVGLGANGKINLSNIADPTNYVIDVQGWYSSPKAATITCASPAADGAVLTETPSAPISCTVSAGPARQSDEALVVLIDGGVDTATLPLSSTGATKQSFSIPNTTGQHSIAVDRVGSDVTVPAEYTFTIGDWRQNHYDNSADTLRETSLTPALFIDATDTPFPEDAQYRYSVFSDYEGGNPIVVSDWTDDEWVAPTGVLQDGATYYWSAEVRGTYNYAGDQDTITTPRFGLSPSATVNDDVTDLPAGDNDSEQSNVNCDPDTGICSIAEADMGYTGWGPAKRTVINKTLVEKKHRVKIKAMYCEAWGSQPCDTDTSATVGVSIGLGLGISRKTVAASLDITANASVTFHYGCHAGPHRGVQAYATGPKYKYKVKSVRYWIGGGRQTTQKDVSTSGWKTAWEPQGVACVERKL